MPHSLTGGAGYKANQSYDDFLRKHSGFYRRHSAASNAMDSDRRASQAADINSDAAQAVKNIEAGRRGSVTTAEGGAATANTRKGSVAVASDVTRKDSIFGLEATGGQRMSEGRRPSTSLASDLMHKMKGNK